MALKSILNNISSIIRGFLHCHNLGVEAPQLENTEDAKISLETMSNVLSCFKAEGDNINFLLGLTEGVKDESGEITTKLKLNLGEGIPNFGIGFDISTTTDLVIRASSIPTRFAQTNKTLTRVHLIGVKEISTYAFTAGIFDTLLISDITEVPTLASTSSINKSYCTNIYVPDELVELFKVATNWTTHADNIKPLSEYTGEVEVL